jgi:hypothetical protein
MTISDNRSLRFRILLQAAGRMWHRRAIPPRPGILRLNPIPRKAFRRKRYSQSVAAFTGL